MDKLTLGTRNVSIEFPGVKALTDVNFEVSTGEIRALVGANGAGKSTLMKVFAGANPDYTGEVYLNDKVVELRTPMAAKKLGIQIVYQEVDMALVPTLSVAENVMLNDMVMSAKGKPLMNWAQLRTDAKRVLEKLHIDVNVRTLVQDLSLAQKQMVLIARAIANECNFLIGECADNRARFPDFGRANRAPERHGNRGALPAGQAPSGNREYRHHLHFPPNP